MTADQRPLLLYDGECAFCREWASWLILRDRQRRLRVCPWQVVTGPPMTPLLRIEAQRAVQLAYPDGHRVSGGRAVIAALRAIGWHPVAMRLLRHRPLIWAIDVGYRIVAANRDAFARFTPR